MDNSVAALAPNAFAGDEMLSPDGQGATAGVATATPDTVAFFTNGYDAARLRTIADSAGLARRYTIPGTPLHLAARRKLEDIPVLAGLLAPE